MMFMLLEAQRSLIFFELFDNNAIKNVAIILPHNLHWTNKVSRLLYMTNLVLKLYLGLTTFFLCRRSSTRRKILGRHDDGVFERGRSEPGGRGHRRVRTRFQQKLFTAGCSARSFRETSEAEFQISCCMCRLCKEASDSLKIIFNTQKFIYIDFLGILCDKVALNHLRQSIMICIFIYNKPQIGLF